MTISSFWVELNSYAKEAIDLLPKVEYKEESLYISTTTEKVHLCALSFMAGTLAAIAIDMIPKFFDQVLFDVTGLTFFAKRVNGIILYRGLAEITGIPPLTFIALVTTPVAAKAFSWIRKEFDRFKSNPDSAYGQTLNTPISLTIRMKEGERFALISSGSLVSLMYGPSSYVLKLAMIGSIFHRFINKQEKIDEEELKKTAAVTIGCATLEAIFPKIPLFRNATAFFLMHKSFIPKKFDEEDAKHIGLASLGWSVFQMFIP